MSAVICPLMSSWFLDSPRITQSRVLKSLTLTAHCTHDHARPPIPGCFQCLWIMTNAVRLLSTDTIYGCRNTTPKAQLHSLCFLASTVSDLFWDKCLILLTFDHISSWVFAIALKSGCWFFRLLEFSAKPLISRNMLSLISA